MIASAISWIGSAALAASPFIIDTLEGKALAIFGLSLLIIQAAKLRAYNLIFINSVGIIGYASAIWNQI